MTWEALANLKGPPGPSHTFEISDFGAVSDGSTDDTDAVSDAVAAAVEAGGGTVLFPTGVTVIRPGAISLGHSDTEMLTQPSVILKGMGQDWRTTTGSNSLFTGSVLDFQGTALGQGVGCIETFGSGYMEITNLVLNQRGTAHTIPFVYSTATTLMITKTAFVGHSTKSQQTCDQDAIVLGNDVSADLFSSKDSRFQGYGTVIERCYFNRIRRAVYGRRASNGVVIRDNTIWNACGATSAEAAIEFRGVSVSAVTGFTVIGNLIEMTGYPYGIRIGQYTNGNNIVFNNFYDSHTMPSTAHVKIADTDANFNLIIAGYSPGEIPLIETDSTTNTVIDPHQSAYSIFPQRVSFPNPSVPVEFRNIKMTGGNTLNRVQPDEDQAENSALFMIQRSAADDVAPGQVVFHFMQDGHMRTYSSANVQWWYGNGRVQAVGGGNELNLNSGTGGHNITARGASLRFTHFSTGNELVRMRPSTHSSAIGAVQLTGTTGPLWTHGTGSPEGVVTASQGSMFTRTDGGAGTTLYIKESGAGNTGWVAK